MMPKRVLIAHTVLDEVCCVEKGLEELSVPFETIPVAAGRAWEALKPEDDDIIFNLLEAPPGRPLLQIAAAGVLELLGVPYTGSRLASLVLTTDKLSTRAVLASEGIAVAPGGRFDPEDPRLLDRVSAPWILKAGFEDASVGLDGEPVVRTREAAVARGRQLIERFPGQPIVLEHYLPGREFNVGVVEVDGVPVILPVAEMTFSDYPDDMPRLVGITGASGYARVDLRLDEAGVPCVLEVNANPCISEGSGLMVAAVRVGYSVGSVIASILQAAQRAHQASDQRLALPLT